jgi:hypothetical protein
MVDYLPLLELLCPLPQSRWSGGLSMRTVQRRSWAWCDHALLARVA